ncbi:MAG: hypothetical protein PHU75_05360 [Candidatus Nanopelagicales bacterium]|nr:hypothetical protein [Candidatus Nanopelagicales bacterium]
MSDEIDDAQWRDRTPVGPEAAFLNPATPPTTPAMPDHVWAGLERTLAQEQAARESATVISLDQRRRPRRTWVLGAAAAGVVLLGVGVVVQSVQSSNADLVASGSGSGVGAPTSQGGFPAKQVLASGMDYQPTTLGSQVKTLLKSSLGIQALASATPGELPMPSPTPTFMMSADGMRSCIDGLTKGGDGTALVVDMARYHGSDAGIVVVPLSVSASTASQPATLHVWVVGPDCARDHTDVLVDMYVPLPTGAAAASE